MNDTIHWLLSSQPYVRYNTLVHLLDQKPDDAQVVAARKAMLTQPMIRSLLDELRSWPGSAITNHKKADLLYHKLAFLADIGLTADDAGIPDIIKHIIAHASPQGIFESQINFPKVFGGTGKDMWGWVLCDSPRLYYSLLKMGVQTPLVTNGLHALASLVKENGFPCAASPKLGSFKGPGKRSDPCPYANLLMLAALLETPNPNHPALYAGAECLLSLWTDSRTRYPFLFHMGTDFRKLKAPFIWYDILHVTDVLSQIKQFQSDSRLLEMISIIKSKADQKERYTAESIWMAWKGWDFAQKKEPSPWITFNVHKILKRFCGAV